MLNGVRTAKKPPEPPTPPKILSPKLQKSVFVHFKIKPRSLTIKEYTEILNKWAGYFSEIQKEYPNIYIHAEIDLR